MQLLTSLVWATFTLCASASGDSLIYFPSEKPSDLSSRASSISPNTARLVLASQLGLSQYHELGDADEETLDTLSQFTTQKIFAQPEPTSKLLLVIDGAEYQEDLLESSKQDLQRLSIRDRRSGPTTNQLIKDLLRPSGHPNLPREADLEIKYISGPKDPSTLAPLISRADIILLPAAHTTNKQTPTLISSLLTQHSLTRRAAEDPDAETPLSPLEDSSPASSSASAPPSSSSEPAFPPPKPGPQPLCHPTLPSLLAATQNCSNHGEPAFRTGGEGKADCYRCRCTATVLRSDDEGTHQKTIRWGGAACNKKDVSMAFWLLAGLTVFLVAVVAWGVGLLMGVGSEELPSVIGAGVAGPRAQK